MMSESSARRPPFDDQTEEGGLLRRFLEQSRSVRRKIRDARTWPAGREILDQSPEVRARIVVLVAQALGRGNQQRSSQTRQVTRVGNLTFTTWDPRGVKKAVGWTYRQGLIMKALMSRLLRSRLPFDDGQLVDLAGSLLADEARDWDIPVTSVVAAIERHVREHGLSEDLRQAVEALQAASRHANSVKIPKTARARLAALVEPNGVEPG